MPSIKEYFVYLTSNKYGTVFYVGPTNHLIRRIWQHKYKLIQGFTSKYNVDKLMYYEKVENKEQAVKREVQLKKWSRMKKIKLIKTQNPKMMDLSEDWFGFGRKAN